MSRAREGGGETEINKESVWNRERERAAGERWSEREGEGERGRERERDGE